MINNEEFALRLKKVMDYYQLSASSFADRIKIQRSSISHLLSGRNKPSLDFVLKVIKEFDEVELYWFLNGKGKFPKRKDSPTPSTEIQDDLTKLSKGDQKMIKKVLSSKEKQLERIVLFYSDGSFKEYIQ